jgi:hypothetical protein
MKCYSTLSNGKQCRSLHHIPQFRSYSPSTTHVLLSFTGFCCLRRLGISTASLGLEKNFCCWAFYISDWFLSSTKSRTACSICINSSSVELQWKILNCTYTSYIGNVIFPCTILVFDCREEGNLRRILRQSQTRYDTQIQSFFCCTDRHFQIQSMLEAVNHEQHDSTIHFASLLGGRSGVRFPMV